MKYAPRKVYIKESGGYVELSYTDFCRRRNADQTYMDKLFIPVQGCLLEVVREQYTDFYRDKERWRYLQKLDAKNSLLSLDGFIDSEGNPLDFIADEAADIAETGEINELKVIANNSAVSNSRWYSGSGIYRDVKLIELLSEDDEIKGFIGEKCARTD